VLRIEQPQAYRVFPQDEAGRAEIAVRVVGESDRMQARLVSGGEEVVPWTSLEPEKGKAWAGTLRAPMGGPYRLEVWGNGTARVSGLLVGDLWITAGQSNADGVGALSEAERPSRLVNAFYYDDRWGRAEEPLCWYNEATDPVHWGVGAAMREEAARNDRNFRVYGAGPAVAFGNALSRATGVPVGLIVCSHGGTSMDQWSPSLRGEGGKSLYGSLLRRVAAVGGRVRGCIWYQGESDTMVEDAKDYRAKMRDFVATLRRDLGNPEMPLAWVQIGKFYGGDPSWAWAWDLVQDQQVRMDISGELGRAAMVPAIDLELCDAIHVGSRGQRILGRRLAEVAYALMHGGELPWGPRPAGAKLEADGRTIRVRFTGRPLARASRVWGFTVEVEGRPVPLAGCRVDRKDPHTVVVRLAAPAQGETRLWYGQGFNPVVSLRDERGRPCPVFGPVTV